MYLLLSALGHETALRDEVARRWPDAATTTLGDRWLAVEGVRLDDAARAPLAFAWQALPHAARVEASSVSAWAERVADAIFTTLPDTQPWRLQVAPHYANVQPADRPWESSQDPRQTTAGWRRCELIRAALLQRLKERRRRLLRRLHDSHEPFAPDESLVQCVLTAPEAGWLSATPAPEPQRLRGTVWPFPLGQVAVPRDPRPPSRAFAKLLEVELRWGTAIGPGETCVDLGAAPGSWSYVALARGARVVAVDRSPLRDDLMAHPGLQFVRGDAFAFVPEQPVDWLLCDVIAAPERSISLLLAWLRRGGARRFAVTIKFKGRDDYPLLDRLQTELPALTREWFLLRLCANKNEVCAFGEALQT